MTEFRCQGSRKGVYQGDKWGLENQKNVQERELGSLRLDSHRQARSLLQRESFTDIQMYGPKQALLETQNYAPAVLYHLSCHTSDPILHFGWRGA